ncbi:Uncharacterised protein [Vibrio cholerae]|nr:Uncharacterised protein [Vibrio cholerae]
MPSGSNSITAKFWFSAVKRSRCDSAWRYCSVTSLAIFITLLTFPSVLMGK